MTTEQIGKVLNSKLVKNEFPEVNKIRVNRADDVSYDIDVELDFDTYEDYQYHKLTDLMEYLFKILGFNTNYYTLHIRFFDLNRRILKHYVR